MQLRLLHLEDSPHDIELVREHLAAEGFRCDTVNVSTRAEFMRAIETGKFDLILADYSLPAFDGISALNEIRAKGLEAPFIFVSGTMGEEIAIEALKHGATDYVLKSRLSRLGLVVRRSLDEAEEKNKRKESELHVQSLSHLGQQLSSTTTPKEAARVIAEVADRMLKWDAFYLNLYDPEQDASEPVLTIDVVNGKRQEIEIANNRSSKMSTISRKALQEGGQLLLRDFSEPPGEGLTPFGDTARLSASLMFAPIRHKEQPIGIVSIQSYTSNAYNQKDIHILQAIADYCGGALSRIRAESDLATTSGQLQILFDNLDELFFSVDIANAKVLQVSAACEKIYGHPAQAFFDNPQLWLETIHPDDRQRIDEMTPSLFAGQTFNQEFRIRRTNGEIRWVEAKVKPAFNGTDTVIRIDGIISDITARKQRERETEALVTVSSALRLAQTRSEMIPIILDQTLELLAADGAILYMRDPATGDIVCELGRGKWSNLIGSRFPVDDKISTQVMGMGKLYLINNAVNDPYISRPDLLGEARAIAVVPLVARGETIGMLSIGRISSIAQYEVRLLNAIADISANAIHRVTLHEKTEQQVQRLAALRGVDMAISASFDVRVTLSTLLDQVIAHLGVDAANVLLVNPVMHTLKSVAARGFRSRAIERAELRLGEGQAGKIALERRTIIVPNLNEAQTTFVRTGLLQGESFKAYCGTPLVTKGQIIGVLEIFHRAALTPEPDWIDFFQTLAAQAAIAIDNAELFENLQRSNAELALAYDATIEGWSKALDLRDKETEGHTQRVAEMTIQLGQQMGMSDTHILHVRRGALLHDIGKMGIPDTILLKASALTDEEWEIMRRHPLYAYEWLSPIPFLRPALDIPYCHHEKWDGTGYPRGLQREEIPIAARIFAIVDVWDALTSDRPYRKGWTREQARQHIQEQAGKHFEPKVVQAFLQMIDETSSDAPPTTTPQ